MAADIDDLIDAPPGTLEWCESAIWIADTVGSEIDNTLEWCRGGLVGAVLAVTAGVVLGLGWHETTHALIVLGGGMVIGLATLAVLRWEVRPRLVVTGELLARARAYLDAIYAPGGGDGGDADAQR